MAAPKSTTPKDSQVMAAILKDMGIIDYEPRVISQMLEFTYRYVTGILEDARVFSSHARKKTLDLDDIKLAIQMQMDKSFTTPPPRDILMDIAKQRNNIPLPLIKPHCGPRLPPDRYCLTSCNFKLKSNKKPTGRSFHLGVPFGSITNQKINVQTVGGSKLTPAMNLPSKTGSTLSLVTKGGNAPSVSIVTRPAQMPSNTITTPPLIKLSAGIPLSSGATNSSDSSSSTPMIITQTIPASIAGKRKREDDDFGLE